MTRVKVIRIHSHGGPDVMSWEDHELAPPGPGEARVRHTAIALNFSDINVRRGGFYQKDPLPMPIILGNEAAGVVERNGLTVQALSEALVDYWFPSASGAPGERRTGCIQLVPLSNQLSHASALLQTSHPNSNATNFPPKFPRSWPPTASRF